MFSHKIDLSCSPYTLKVSSCWFPLLEKKLQNCTFFPENNQILGLEGLESGSSCQEPSDHSGCERVKGEGKGSILKYRAVAVPSFPSLSLPSSSSLMIVLRGCCNSVQPTRCSLLLISPPASHTILHTASGPVFLNFLSPTTPESHFIGTYRILWIVSSLYEQCVSPGKWSAPRKDGPYLCLPTVLNICW